MKRDVSFLLLGLILLLCMGIAAASMYYQYTYSELQLRYGVADETLQKTMSDYQEKEAILDAVLQNLSLSEAREGALGEKYVEVETEKEGLQTELKKANNAIEALEKKKRELENRIDELEDGKGKLEFEVAQLEQSIECLYGQVKELDGTATPCATKP